MTKVGITGGIGSGKSFVSKILRSMNYPVFNSDSEAKKIIQENKEVREDLIALFGEETFSNNELNKAFLANIIFNDNEALEKVNAIVHPKVRQAFEAFAKIENNSVVFNEAAILFESGGHSQLDKVILISAPMKLRLQRVMNRDHSTEKEVLARMNKQWTDEQKRELADFEIINDEQQPLVHQIEEVLMKLKY
ncbi:MAG TPA: dephospho-CoA kinase [Crocinitomicaceae bacterium]|nr:dephospho-CoA kinase [Crocinitomicaceae bacterium]